jgi:Protein of unknown function (DUF2752)
MLQMLGLPCPFCGGTRALAAVASLELWRALSLNPLVVASLVLWPLGFRYANRPWFLPVCAGLLVANWAYVLLSLPR